MTRVNIDQRSVYILFTFAYTCGAPCGGRTAGDAAAVAAAAGADFRPGAAEREN